MIQVSAPAKIILFGEHAVVYGEPAIAVPLNALRAAATAEPTDEPLVIIAQDMQRQQITIDVENPLSLAVRLTLDTLQAPLPHARLVVASDIPIASGLGSGAAITTCIVRALCAVLGKTLSKERQNEIVYEVEKIHHGTPSGIDNTVIVYEQAVYFVREQPIQVIDNAQEFTLLIADTGTAALTKVAVSAVRDLHTQERGRIQPVLQTIGDITRQARQAMAAGDLSQLGRLMVANHQELQKLTVSSPELDGLVDAALSAGALGAKLSGGGRGGNMIALVTPETKAAVRDALQRAGAARIIETTLEQTG